jgi:glycosyltransferase involved in cell wall biosynthesis
MRILQVLNDPYGYLGGISVHVRNIAERLSQRNDVTVYAINNRPMLPTFEIQNGVKIKRFRCYSPGNAYHLSLEMLLAIRKEEFDVVHAHGYHAFPFHFASLAKYDKFVTTPHFHGSGHSSFRNACISLLKPVGEQTFKKASAIIAVSEYEKELICQQFGFASSRITVIPNGVNFGEFSNLKKEAKSFRSILYVGVLSPYKGVQYLVEVLPKLPEDVVLEIVGRGPLRPFLEKRAKQLNVLRRIRFYEEMDRHELLQKFANADVFMMLSLYEAYSLVVAEALVAGTRCVVGRTSALTEWIDDESCFGIDVPPNLDQLARLLNRILSHKAEESFLGKRLKAKILDWDIVAAQTEIVYEKSCKARSIFSYNNQP